MPRHPEVLLISSVIQTSDIDPAEKAGLRARHFHAYGAVWEWLTDYVARYRKVPCKSVFRRAFPDFPLVRADDVAWCVEEVRRHHMTQELAAAVNEAVAAIKADDPDQALMLLAPTVSRLEQDFDTGRVIEATTQTDEILDTVMGQIERATTSGTPGVTTGFPTLDLATGGFHPGHYAVVAARLKNGKSWVMTKMAVEAAMSGHNVLFHTLEMSASQLTFRAHTFLGRMLGHRFRNWELSSGQGLDLNDYRRFLKKIPDTVPGKLLFVDRARGKMTPWSISANIERHRPDIVFIDYVQLMASTDSRRADWEGLAQLSGSLQSLAKESGVPLVVASQINRDGERGHLPPSVDQISRSDAIGQDADTVITLRQHSRRVIQIRLAAYRHGAAGQVFWALFDPDHGRIEECTHDDALDFMGEDADEDEE